MKNFAKTLSKMLIFVVLVAIMILSVVATTQSDYAAATATGVSDDQRETAPMATEFSSDITEATVETCEDIVVTENVTVTTIKSEEGKENQSNNVIAVAGSDITIIIGGDADEELVHNAVEERTEAVSEGSAVATTPEVTTETKKDDGDKDKSTNKVEFKEVDECLYVNNKTLNVRVGPSTKCDKITSIKLNTKVHRIGIGSNGWSKIDYNGQEAYVASNCLSYTETHVETVEEEMKRRGNIGRLTIPSVDVDVALFQASAFGGAQSIVDAKDSAAYMDDATSYFGQILIGDHEDQGFASMKKSEPGSTYAYIDFGTYTQAYICTKKFVGKNTGKDLVDLNDVSIDGQNNGGICMYTCNNDGTITLTYWQPA